jgi:hypothetical protein
MAMGPSYGKALARKAAPPDRLEALVAEPDADEAGGPSDADSDDPEEMSAWEDFARAAGIKPSPAAYDALKELIRICSRK